MREQGLIEKINDIDDDLVQEAASAGKVRKFPLAKILAAAACLAVCAVAAISISGMRMGKKSGEAESVPAVLSEVKDKISEEKQCIAEEIADESEIEAENMNSSECNTSSVSRAAIETNGTKSETSVSEKSYDDLKQEGLEEKSAKTAIESADGSYGGDNWFCIPTVPENKVKVTGEKITDTEANAYFNEHRTKLANELSSSGVPADNIEISKRGYSHLCYDGSTLKYLELRQNFRDYPVYNNGKLIAIVTLVKQNGKITDTPSFGAPWFSTYSSYLNSHKGEKLVYLYVGNLEVIISPDGNCFSPLGNETKRYFEGIDEPYGYFYDEGAVFVP